MPPCRNGPNCTRPNCHFTHAAVDVPCKFNPCLNPSCVFKHTEGQQQGTFDHKVWTPNTKPHVSERKFVNEEEGEELIIPGQSRSSPPNNAAQQDMEMGGERPANGNMGLEVTV